MPVRWWRGVWKVFVGCKEGVKSVDVRWTGLLRRMVFVCFLRYMAFCGRTSGAMHRLRAHQTRLVSDFCCVITCF